MIETILIDGTKLKVSERTLPDGSVQVSLDNNGEVSSVLLQRKDDGSIY